MTCGKFKRFSLSLHGPSVHGALPVIQHQQPARSFLELDVDMKEEKPDPQQQEDDSLTQSCGTYQDDITDEHTPIDRWLPTKPIEKTIIVGKPSYVDNNGLIYLEQEPVLNALRKVINAMFADSSATDKFYSDNEPCMAKFHQDNKFVYIAIGFHRYKVQFIDYGNIEE
ncbi:hypothetical protein quinque_002106 [Culex quinquefasciatus]